ncbi:MAG: WecB/TagA/CpsF family glycosyltransferase [Paracoccaceae bacterium]
MHFRIANETVMINVADREALLMAVRARWAARQGFAVATLNLDHLVKLRQSPAFLAAYLQHDLVVADGNPVVWLSRLAKRPVGLVPGSDLVVPLANVAAVCGVKVALIGTTEAALQTARQSLLAAVPGLDIALCLAPPMGFDPTSPAAATLLQRLQDHQIGLCFLALGAPKQENLAARGRVLAPDVGFVSVGAGLDFLAGTQARAPLWVRKLALEWLWRTLQSPARMIPRYAACAALLPRLAIEAWLRRGTP